MKRRQNMFRTHQKQGALSVDTISHGFVSELSAPVQSLLQASVSLTTLRFHVCFD